LTGRTYEHDVIIRLSGKVKKRQKKLSKRQYGTSHIISRAEAKFGSRRDAMSSSSASVTKGTCDCLRKSGTILRRRDAV
jgi:hypothetical protein